MLPPLLLRALLLAVVVLVMDGALSSLAAGDPPPPAETRPANPALPEIGIEKLTENARKSVVVVTVQGRDGLQQGLGSGFVVAADGLIATNLHVIGEARPVSVQTADGKKFDVTAIEAYDRPLDLALVRIDAKNLPVLPLGNSDALKQGQGVIALGNPQGLKHSVVAGVVSGTREIDGRQMIQLAIPIEPGNSGGPLLDLEGRVHGILTMKSAVTENLGFAMPVNALKPLIEKPNPTPISRWLTIGALDPREWKPLFGARWRQRAGRILVDGVGQGFGGRSLCLSEQPAQETPFEIAVAVKLDHEEGAAGLVFCADGGDVHYGFYPSAGKLRLSRFDGPDVFSWKVLAEVPSEHYRPGDWNTLKVRFEKGRIRCSVNDRTVVESSDDKLAGGRVGLAKFRTTEAEFRQFRIGKELPAASPADDVVARIQRLAADLPPVGHPPAELAEKLSVDGQAGVTVLRDRAKQMEQQAAQLRKLAQGVHQRRVQRELVQALDGAEDKVDLFHAALLVALLDNDEVDVESYRRELDRIARDIAKSLPDQADAATKLAALNRYLFQEQGFHGSRGDYYHRSNSYVNEVLDDREGLPITLSLIYIELARRLELKVVGVGLPGHFVVRYEPAEGASQLIDVYDGGVPLPAAEAEKMIRAATGRAPQESDFTAATKRAIIARMLHNLLGVAQRAQDAEGMLRYLDVLVAISPDTGDERWMRAVMLFRTGRRDEAIRDVDWLLDHRPEGVNLNQVDELRRLLERPER
ncbi:MAG TPA: transglutaminase family protein [Planctomycetaceae bacterium]|nr:transglutaminase family protein [Planctomycetaceae bacterium]